MAGRMKEGEESKNEIQKGKVKRKKWKSFESNVVLLH